MKPYTRCNGWEIRNQKELRLLRNPRMVKEAGEFMGMKIYVYSTGIRGFFERLWHDLKYKTVFVPELPKNHGPFSYARFNAGRFLLKERGWYRWYSQYKENSPSSAPSTRNQDV